MKIRNASGFTLVEVAIVLVIIGLLLGGILKGQELINSAKVKSMAADFRNLQVMIFSYQDKYRRLPGDDNNAQARWTLATGHEGNGNGAIDGLWNAETPSASNESVLLWEHLRRANLATGATDFSSQTAAALPRNTEGGRFGASSQKPLNTLTGGSLYACSDAIDGKFAEQLDLAQDDGRADSGSMQAIAQMNGQSQADGSRGAANSYTEGTRYTVCMSY